MPFLSLTFVFVQWVQYPFDSFLTVRLDNLGLGLGAYKVRKEDSRICIYANLYATVICYQFDLTLTWRWTFAMVDHL